ncbi:polyribonucleotide nucleotidyltransferase [Candidatus Pseudothioglobus singularis]|jgi:polyribonucleotide nucleotidyltransferase|uniref:Polyribonucleotide nucleotidyltransferase n=1 Tax=Candidatus Pseudothioglobus singularis PS1 TaxID=1125411 RepID=A0A0M4L571_9GAMM|nr:polyribonucleotide nucleotidyltransferase [Candidatus Pseudothioglobus singularis]ALE01763.1 polynucleotide phosphorylase/polyadenylase [Candidatus Pseudothioglobus singularis PS1]MDA8855171.1 polyribonucleotide nucleotidyltransferase [Candidatus Pseudothioglobus singularis]MDB0021529.1 polyribonucleotide nucleotidyltransferase [Candidatus Pseudothioglobus singularis]MDB4598803.1 polyribonucleotide nucleotidyltransferase [Candidatus Pseudothioglobus singularis]MDB4847198.1 polyribonucleotid|tara:strand:- start:557 stop:2647 length:2091 start_codon:yes stop_codon:yes gene_type:complete
MDMNIVQKSFTFGNSQITFETGRVARQAHGAVLASMDDTQVLVSVVGAKEAKPGQSFFPLSVDYIEKTYAAGKIPGGFLKREGRPSEKETLTSRLIDRPIRPLFPNGYMNEVQVMIQVISANKNVDPDVLAMLGTSAALAISGVPFKGPIGAARVGFKDGSYMVNPTYSELETSELDMVVAGTKDAVLMVESEASELSEEVMLGGVMYAHEQFQVVIDNVAEFAKEVGIAPREWVAPADNETLLTSIKSKFESQIAEAYQTVDKMERYEKMGEVKDAALEEFVSEDDSISQDEVKNYIKKIEKSTVRERILAGEPRIDGRDNSTVRELAIETGVLENTHGSALFTRGETQALVVTTLGSKRDAQLIEKLESNDRIEDHFMLHYNFPPYCVGETGRVMGVKRREVGHGRLARRGISACLPNLEEFPYTIRVVSEITESNGSSSMASVCGSSLSLMDAGVPLKAPVAGIAMGLVKDDERFTVLTDILGDEDHLGDMDFKVAGTTKGINALQMDIKIDGITEDIMSIALKQAKDARLNILGQMNEVISEPNSASKNAPKTKVIKIPTDKIRDVIGKGGETIRGIVAQSGASVDVDDDGNVNVFANDSESFEKAVQMVKDVTAVPEVNKVYMGKVAKIVEFGAFITIMPNQDGLLHVSEIAHERVEKVEDYLKEGEEIEVKVLGIDRGRIKLSRKVLIEK